MEKRKILLISTGGTIAGNVSDDKSGSKEHTHAEDFKKQIAHTVDRIKSKWGIETEVVPVDLKDENDEIVDEDSSNIVPNHWVLLSDKIKKEYDEFDAFIVTHGTNTLGYTSAALSFSLVNSNKPVILTGSQVPFGYPGSDALMNLDNSLRVAVWPYNKIKGVVVVFGSSILSGTRAKKTTEFNYDAFNSFSSIKLGEVGRIIQIKEKALKGHNDYYNPAHLDFALTSEDLMVKNEFNTQIVSLSEYPGMSPDIFRTLVENFGAEGFVLRAFGAGDPSSRFLEVFRYLKEKEIPLVITTQAPNGNSNFQVNAPGKKLKDENLAIPAYNMSMESQIAKLSWLLGQNYTYEQVQVEFLKDHKGEIETMKERKQ